MLIHNNTPCAALGFGDLHRDGMTMAVVGVRASYDLSSDGLLRFTSKQEMVLNDIYEGDPHRTPLLKVGDLIPYKPEADITLLANAQAPGGRPVQNWQVGITVGSHTLRLRVHGPRRWEPTLKFLKPTWKLGASELVAIVPLDYRLSAGGRIAGDPEGGYDNNNPIGPGLLHSTWSRIGIPLTAPQIDAEHATLDDPFEKQMPRGVGPIPPFWAAREKHLGTRDEVWQRDRCPQMPADLSYQFFQTAHPDLILPYLSGDETIRLEALVPGCGSLAFKLPGIALLARHEWSDGRAVNARLALDGLHMDFRAPEAPWRIDLTWRGWIVRCPTYRGASLSLASIRDVASLPISNEYGLHEPDMNS